MNNIEYVPVMETQRNRTHVKNILCININITTKSEYESRK